LKYLSLNLYPDLLAGTALLSFFQLLILFCRFLSSALNDLLKREYDFEKYALVKKEKKAPAPAPTPTKHVSNNIFEVTAGTLIRPWLNLSENEFLVFSFYCKAF
jgi:hypothetical protein